MDHDNILEESNSLSADSIWHTTEIRKKAFNWNQFRDARLIGEKYGTFFLFFLVSMCLTFIGLLHQGSKPIDSIL